MKDYFQHFILLILILQVTSCKIADISETSHLSIAESERIATEKIAKVILAQGFKVMEDKNTYQFSAKDHWPKLIGKLVKIWPNQHSHFQFKHNFNTFDGNAIFLNGKRQGDLIGVQSWNYYEKNKNTSKIENKDTGKKPNKLEFGMVIFHYFLELPVRLKNAPIKRYYGQKTLRNENYDLVFATWGSESANKQYDQYIIWINKKTNLIDYCVYTLRDNTNPITRKKYGSIAYQDYTDIDGFKVPLKMPVMLDDNILKKKSFDNYFHQFTIQNFEFGGFDESELYPFNNINKQIDSK